MTEIQLFKCITYKLVNLNQVVAYPLFESAILTKRKILPVCFEDLETPPRIDLARNKQTFPL